MAFTGITSTEGEIDQKTGANVDTNYTDAMKTLALLQAESFLNIYTKYNWSDWYATTPNVDLKYAVTECTASLVAVEAIKYNTLAYPTLEEAENSINILFTRAMQIAEMLKDPDIQNWIGDND